MEQIRLRLATLSDWITKHIKSLLTYIGGSGLLVFLVGVYLQKDTIRVALVEEGVFLETDNLRHINLRMRLNNRDKNEQGRNEGAQVLFENVKLSVFGSDWARFTLDSSSKYVLVDTTAREVPENHHLPLKVIRKKVPVRVILSKNKKPLHGQSLEDVALSVLVEGVELYPTKIDNGIIHFKEVPVIDVEGMPQQLEFKVNSEQYQLVQKAVVRPAASPIALTLVDKEVDYTPEGITPERPFSSGTAQPGIISEGEKDSRNLTTQEYAVHTLQNITINDVQAGNVVQVEASGSIIVGPFVGSSTPGGRDSGVAGLSLEGYNIVRAFPHAALLYRFPGDDEWKFCGNGVKFKAASNGPLTIQFQVNDAYQGNNRGDYIVRITVQEQ